MDTIVLQGGVGSRSYHRAIAERIDMTRQLDCLEQRIARRDALPYRRLVENAELHGRETTSYDIGIIGNVLPSLTKQFQLGAFAVGVLAIASTLGIVVAIIPALWPTV